MSDPSLPHIYMWTPGIYDGSRHFVFFDSLKDEELKIFHNQWIHAYNYFATPLGRNPFARNRTMQKLENSLDFLYNAMLIERNKEMAYVNSFLSRNGMSTVSTPTTINGWAEFFNAIQEAKTGTGDFLDKLQEEKTRIENNREYMKKVEANSSSMTKQEYERAKRGYNHGKNSELARATERRINTIITGTMNKGNFATEVCEYISKRYSKELWDYIYSGKDIRPVLAGIQVMVDQLIYVQLNKTLTGKNGIFSDKATKAERMDTIGRLIQENPLGAQLDALMASQDKINRLETAVRSSMGMKENQNKKQNKKKLASVASLIEKAEATRQGRERTPTLDKLPLPTNNFCEIKIQKGQMSEIETAVNGIIITALDKGVNAHASYGSGQNAFQATDVMELMLITKNSAVNEYAKSMMDDLNRLNEMAAKKFQNVGANGRTKENAREMTKMYEDYYAELLRKLEKYQEFYDDAAELFHIETSNKDYEAMGLYGTNEFKGATLGSGAEDVAARILMMTEGSEAIAKYQQTGGLSAFDVNWLSNAILNSGEHMVARRMRGAVINYLQMFAAFLMFDDFGVMAKNYIDAMAHNAQSSLTDDKGIHTIHLYKLQTFYMPSSYILEQVYTHMKKSLQNIFQEVNDVGHGVKVSITGNNYEYERPKVDRAKDENGKPVGPLLNPREAALTEERWEQEGEKAMKNTKVEMTFMGSFLDFINEFINPANSK